MKSLQQLIPILFVGVLSTGCIPYRFTTRPGASGRVLDSQTQSPVAGAVVSLSAQSGHAAAKTALDGSFLIPAQHQWWVCFIGMDPMRWSAEVTVSADGYGTAKTGFIVFATGPGVTRLGDVLVERVK